MPNRSRLVAVGLAAFAIALIVFFPARVAYRWFAPETVAISGISGSVWNGKAREADVGGVYLHELTWSFRPASLLTGKLAYAVAARPGSGFVNAHAAFGITGTVVLQDVQASVSLQALQNWVPMPGLYGDVSARFERLQFDKGLLVAANGVLEISGLVAPLVHSASIGGYRAEFFTQESGVMASVEDTDGLVDLAGTLKISSDRNYEFVAQLAAKNNTPAQLRDQMQFLGTANDRGQHELRLEGKL